MKKLLFILTIYCNCCQAQDNHAVITLSPGGLVFNRVYKLDSLKYIFIDSMKSATSFTRYGNGSAGAYNYSDSGLTISVFGAGTNGYDSYVQYNSYNTNLEQFTIEQPFTPLGDSAGIGIGTMGTFGVSALSSYVGRIVLSGATRGQLRCDVITGVNTVKNLGNSGTNYFSVTHGRGYILSFKRTPDSLVTRITDTLSGATMSISVQPRYDSVAYFLGWRQSQICLMWYGGKIRTYNMKFYSPVPKRANMLFVGDSNMQGELAGTSSNRFAQQTADYFKGTYAIDAGASDAAVDIIALLPEILLINPKSVFIAIGTNDQLSDSATFKHRLDSIITPIYNAGIKIYLGTIFPTTGGFAALNSVIRAMPNVTIIDFDSTLSNGYSYLCPCYYSGIGGVHLNGAGNTVVANLLKSTLTGYLIPN